jgi:hypothetical protein
MVPSPRIKTTGALALALATLFSVAPANATPINPPTGGTGTLVCNGQAVLITIPSFFGLTPRMSVDGTTRFIPLSLTLTITDLTTNEVLSSQTASRAPGAADMANASCVDISTQVDPSTGDVLEYNFTSQDIETPVG